MPAKHHFNAQQAALLLIANLLIQYVIGLAIYDFRGALDISTHEQSAFVSLLGNGLWLAGIVHFQGGTYRELLHPSTSSWLATTVLLCPAVVMLVPLLLLLDVGLMDVLLKVWDLSRWEEAFFSMMNEATLPVVVSVVVLAPILEEMVFRGVLLRAFLVRYPKWPAIAISALFFGFAHLNVYQFVLAFALGLLLGWLYERSRSLIPCIALHATFNGANVLIGQQYSSNDVPSLGDFSLQTWALSVLAFAIGALLLFRVLANRPQSVA